MGQSLVRSVCYWVQQQASAHVADHRPKRLFLVRHGESLGNVDPTAYARIPDNQIPLTEEGKSQAEEAGRALPDDFPVVARLMVVVTDDAPAARQMLKGVFAPYAATTGYNRFFRWIGYEEEATAIAEAAERGDRAAMIEAYSDEMANDVLVIGNADEVATKVRAYLDAGVTIAAIEPLAPGVEAATMTLKAASAALD